MRAVSLGHVSSYFRLIFTVFLCLVRTSMEMQPPTSLTPSFTFSAIPPHHPGDPMLTNVNNNNNNCYDNSESISEAAMTTLRVDDDVTDVEHDAKKSASQGGGDACPNKGGQFISKHHDALQMDFQPGDPLGNTPLHSRSSFPYGQARRVVPGQSVYPGQGGTYATRHFSWYKPGQSCLPAVGEEEAERTQIRNSPLSEDPPIPQTFFPEHGDVTSPFTDSSNADVTSKVPSYDNVSPPISNETTLLNASSDSIFNSASHSEGLSISDPANLDRNSNGKSCVDYYYHFHPIVTKKQRRCCN